MARGNLNFSFPKLFRLRKSHEYLTLKRHGRTYSGLSCHLRYLSKENADSKLGITVSKKYGRAHQRNRFKRLCREVFRINREKLPKGTYLNISPKFGVSAHSLAEIEKDFITFALYLEKKKSQPLSV